MTITIEKKAFLNAIKAVKIACEKGKLQPILNTIHIESISGGLQLTATDCNNISKAIIEANNNSSEKIDICINADKLENIVSRLDDLVTLEIKNTNANIIIKSGKTKFNCLYMDGSEFPSNANIIPFDEENKVIFKKEELINAINKTVYATLQDTTGNAIISGLCFTFLKNIGYEVAATDGNRLSQVISETKNININGQYVIPKKILLEITRFIDKEIEVSFIDKSISFKTANYLYSSKLLNGTYPPYKQLIPETEKQKVIVRVKKDELLKAIDTVSIMANERTMIVTLFFSGKDNQLKLSCNCSDGDADENIGIDFILGEKEDLKIAFNYKYLIDCIKIITEDELTFNIKDGLSACLIKSDFNYLIMPIHVR